MINYRPRKNRPSKKRRLNPARLKRNKSAKKLSRNLRSIYKDRRELHSKKQSPLAKIAYSRTFKYALLVFLAITSLIAVLWHLFYIDNFKVVVSQNSALIPAEVRKGLENQLNQTLARESNYLKQHFFLDLDRYREIVSDNIYVADLEFRRDSINANMVLEIEPRLVWADFQTPDIQTIVTDDGWALTEYKSLFKQDQSRFIVSSPYYINNKSQQILSFFDIDFIKQFRAYLKTHDYEVEQVKITLNPRELIFRIKGYNYDIITLTSHDPIKQAIALDTAIKFFADSESDQLSGDSDQDQIIQVEGQEGSSPEEYVDVRSINTVIFK